MIEKYFIFDSVDSLYYDLNKISLNRGGTYFDFPEWLKNKNGIINPPNEKMTSAFNMLSLLH